MSNRRKPRVALHEFRIVDDVRTALVDLDQYRCPDCDSTFSEPVMHGEQVARIEVRHDDTCPWLRRWTA